MATRRILTLLVVLSVFAAACTGTVTSEAEIDRQQQTIEQMVEQLAVQATTIKQLEEELNGLGIRVDTFEVPPQLSGDLVQLKRDLRVVDANASEAYGAAQDALGIAEDALDRTEEITTCVNDYMDVIGRWSSNVNSYFDWFYC
jgi:hypothetical protein